MNKQQSAYEDLRNLVNRLGITMSQADLQAIAKSVGRDDQKLQMLQARPEYKKRFAANDARMKAGLPTLSDQEYLSLEDSYRQQARAAGLPSGFWDRPTDFAKLIANDVSPSEFGERVKIAEDAASKFDAPTRAALKEYYGIDSKGLTAYALDPKRALPQLQKMAEAAQIGGEAKRNGIGVSGSFAEHLVNADVEQGQARQAFAAVAEEKSTVAKLGAIDKQTITTGNLVDAQLGLDAKTVEKKRSMASRERARFGAQAQTGAAAQAQSGAGSY